MSAFLWVEDFDSDDALNTTTANVFGSYIGNLNQDWDSAEHLQESLEEFNIYLERSLVDALNFINDQKKRDSIDYVILDIDLRISRGKKHESGNSGLEKIFAWHTSSNEDDRRGKLKKIAGYHLWTLLVIDHGFPRDRIQFCSQHGGPLEQLTLQKSIQESFESARITPPEIFLKRDKRIQTWINKQANDPYTSLRRGVIDSCALLLKRLDLKQGDAPEMIRLSRFPGSSTEDFKRDQAVDMLNMLPLYLPRDVSPESMPEVLRAFVRAFTMNWDRFSAHPEQIIKYEVRTGISYNKAIDKVSQNGATALKFLRNRMAHAAGKSVNINPALVAVFFVLNMRIIFWLNADKDLNVLESTLLPKYPITEMTETAKSLHSRLERWWSTLEAWCQEDKVDLYISGKKKGVDFLFRELQIKGRAMELKYILLTLWCQLSYGTNESTFKKRFNAISTSSDPVHRVAMACLGELL